MDICVGPLNDPVSNIAKLQSDRGDYFHPEANIGAPWREMRGSNPHMTVRGGQVVDGFGRGRLTRPLPVPRPTPIIRCFIAVPFVAEGIEIRPPALRARVGSRDLGIGQRAPVGVALEAAVLADLERQLFHHATLVIDQRRVGADRAGRVAELDRAVLPAAELAYVETSGRLAEHQEPAGRARKVIFAGLCLVGHGPDVAVRVPCVKDAGSGAAEI